MTKKVAVITGASSGIGAETVRALVEADFRVFMGARRMSRLNVLAEKYGAIPLPLDVTQTYSVQQFVNELPDSVQVLINNAGGALGLEPIASMDENQWLNMYQSNVLGLARMSKALYPRLLADSSQVSHVVNIGSVAGFETYGGPAIPLANMPSAPSAKPCGWNGWANPFVLRKLIPVSWRQNSA